MKKHTIARLFTAVSVIAAAVFSASCIKENVRGDETSYPESSGYELPEDPEMTLGDGPDRSEDGVVDGGSGKYTAPIPGELSITPVSVPNDGFAD